MLIQDDMQFCTDGRRSVEFRMEMLYGHGILVLKAKSVIQTSVDGLIGRVLTPDQLHAIFGDMIYEDWAGESNMITEPAQLYKVESNKASSYLIFQQLS